MRLSTYRCSCSASRCRYVARGVVLKDYEPMRRLLGPEDHAFLATQPGFGRKLAARLRREHRRIFRMYLRDLAADFHSLHAAQPAAEPSFKKLALAQEIAFWRAIAAIELKLLMPGSDRVDGQALLYLVAALQSSRMRPVLAA